MTQTHRYMRDSYKQIKDDWQVAQTLHQECEEIRRYAFQSVNLTAETDLALSHTYRDCIFIGCQLPMGLKKKSKDCLFLPDMGETFRYRNHLYSPEEPCKKELIRDVLRRTRVPTFPKKRKI